jgi:adenosylcobinamide kinase / adenosylcobinamide-phosphate guanylyltransferase
MEIRFTGTAGPPGWPAAGCRCASCMRLRITSNERRGAEVVIDGQLRLDPGREPGPARGYRIEPVPGGWDVTSPDGTRLLAAGGPGLTPDPPGGTRAYDAALLDLLHDPAQLGALRRRRLLPGPRPGPGGRAGDRTSPGPAPGTGLVAALYADHRISSAAELARRCGLWGALSPADGDVLTVPPAPRPAAAGRPEAGRPEAGRLAVAWPHRTLVLGGARSGKSAEAERRLAGEPHVTYLAAGPYPGGSGPDEPDPEWDRRIAAHRAARPRWWPTIESTDVAGVLSRPGGGAILVDGIGTWLTAVMTEAGAWDAGDAAAQAALAARVDELVAAWRQASARVVAVSDQVGGGIVPATAAGRAFRDQLGWLNQRLAAESEETVLVAAGKVLGAVT